MARIIDLTKPIYNKQNDVFFAKIKIKHMNHNKMKLRLLLLGLILKNRPKGWNGWADDIIKQMGVHTVTHIDAPWHYGPVAEGKHASTIDELPLDMFYGNGVVIDMTHKKDMEIISRDDIEGYAKENNLNIAPGVIVFIRTDRDRFLGAKEFYKHGAGVSAEATEWLIDQGVKVMGIDQFGWDRPMFKMARLARKNHDPELFWEGHRVGLKKPYCHIEQVVGLKNLPKDGFKVMAMPLPLVGCSASPVRLVAILDE